MYSYSLNEINFQIEKANNEEYIDEYFYDLAKGFLEGVRKNYDIMMKMKMDYRDYIFTYYVKKILDINSTLPIFLFIGENHLNHLQKKLEAEIADCEIKIIEFSDLDKKIRAGASPSDVTALSFFSPSNKPLEQKVGEVVLSSTTPTEPLSKPTEKNRFQH